VQNAIPDPPIFRPRRLGHVNLWVSDLKVSERFYSEVCGLTVEFTEPGLIAAFLGTGHTPHDLGMIEKTNGEARYGRDGLLQLPPGIGLRAGLNHLAWEVYNEAELVESFHRLESAGVKTHLTVDHQVAHSVYLRDPDGNEIEFYCDTIKNWRKVMHGEMDLITSDWVPGKDKPTIDPRWDDAPVLRRVESAPIHPYRVTHAVLVTPDVRALASFYATVGGLSPVHGVGNDAVMMRGSHSGYHFNLAICAGGMPRYHHTSFELTSVASLDRAESRLKERGVPIERRVDLPWKRSFFLRDPDGLLTEYYVRRPGEVFRADVADIPIPYAV
jgi:catechol 2,3-dioxygenase